jgi:site-specific DNA recombinase
MNEGIVVVYARVSTIDGRQDYTRQINELKVIIRQHGYTEDQIEVYKEKISGYKKDEERPQLFQLLSKIRDNPKRYLCLYTSEISRIGRDPKKTREFIDELTELGVPIYIQSLGQYTIEKNGKRNMIMSIILQVLIEYSNFESETFKTRSKSGLLKSVKEGKVGGGKYIPYGYRKGKNKMMEIDEEESDVIKQLFQLYQEGNGIKVISNILNERKIPTRTNKSFSGVVINFKIPKSSKDIRWSDKQIHDIIRNPIYIGKRRFKGEVIQSPPIISEELFEFCNDLMKTKKNRNITTTYTYLLKDIVKCGVCGRNFFGRYKPIPRGDKVYKCSSTLKKGGSCGNVGVNIKFIESVIFNDIVKSNLLQKELKKTDKLRGQLETNLKRLRNQITIDQNNLEEKIGEMDRLLEVYLRGSINLLTFEKKKDEIEKGIDQLKDKMKLQKKESLKLEKSIGNFEDDTLTKNIIRDSKNDRLKLRHIYSQIIEGVFVSKINENLVLVTLIPKINLWVYTQKFKYFLDLEHFRKPKGGFRYKVIVEMKNEPVFENGILMSNRTLLENEFLKNQEDWIEVSTDNIVEMI